jgi:signal transduction histidine kinase
VPRRNALYDALHLVAGFSLRHAATQYEEVTRAKGEMEQLSARLLELEEEGRRRLSRELHDEIGQTLAVLEIEISHAQSLTVDSQPAVRDRLRRARELAGKTVQTVRDISLLLRPALLDDLGLTPAEEGVQELPPDSVKTCVYRVVQEALHNCEKHAEASQVRVDVRQSPDHIRVEMEDNGRGLELNTKGMPGRNAGLGILGMRERAARVGGALTLESSPGRGTRISLQIPLAGLAGSSVRAAAEAGVSA